MDLRDKIVLMTGGARIGQAVSEALAKEGCHIFLIYRSSKKTADDMLKKIQSHGVKGLSFQADVRQDKDLNKIIPSVTKEFGRIDILINMASLYNKTPLSKLYQELQENPSTNPSSWSENMDTNLRSAYWLSLQAAPVMKKNGGGRIINFSDWISSSERPRYKDYIPYYVSKVGIKGLTEALALELAPEILVNTIAPGPIVPPPNLTHEENQEVLQSTPLNKWGNAEEIAKAVVFLCQTDFVTGECLRVDGGRHLY